MATCPAFHTSLMIPAWIIFVMMSELMASFVAKSWSTKAPFSISLANSVPRLRSSSGGVSTSNRLKTPVIPLPTPSFILPRLSCRSANLSNLGSSTGLSSSMPAMALAVLRAPARAFTPAPAGPSNAPTVVSMPATTPIHANGSGSSGSSCEKKVLAMTAVNNAVVSTLFMKTSYHRWKNLA